MSVRPLLLASVCVMLLLAPMATAQKMTPAMTMRAEGPTDIAAGETIHVRFEVRYIGDLLPDSLLTSGIPVTYTVTEKPAWANVILSPSSDVIRLAPGQTEAVLGFAAVVSAVDSSPVGEWTLIEVHAQTPESTLRQGADAKASIALHAVAPDAPEEPCHEPATQATEEVEEEPSDLTVQTANLRGKPPLWLPAIASVVGAAAGFVLLRRRG